LPPFLFLVVTLINITPPARCIEVDDLLRNFLHSLNLNRCFDFHCVCRCV
jgi:hypothetical protein